MTINKLGSIGEFLASIGALVSLVFVGIQMRHNAAATRSSIRQQTFDSSINFLTLQIDPATAAGATYKV